ncbi:uncharacterized protein LOC120354908 [Nilaparvata lugens]|uniref:uncharacterized protein LOC120354908 n=1 Tax=Nilaparvata lugens TaxID=108931 RepID=UPI00193D0C6F|nr:uncharacterized protein LOC120354908 [Nilaparvata lugens]
MEFYSRGIKIRNLAIKVAESDFRYDGKSDCFESNIEAPVTYMELTSVNKNLSDEQTSAITMYTERQAECETNTSGDESTTERDKKTADLEGLKSAFIAPIKDIVMAGHNSECNQKSVPHTSEDESASFKAEINRRATDSLGGFISQAQNTLTYNKPNFDSMNDTSASSEDYDSDRDPEWMPNLLEDGPHSFCEAPKTSDENVSRKLSL